MRLAIAFAYFVCLGFAQSSANLDAVRYPPLAVAASIQGDVLISGGKVISGPPLLRQTALQLHAPQTDALVHFVLIDVVLLTRIETIKKGDAFDRFFMRLLRIPTTRKIATEVCTQGPNAPANRTESAKEPIEVWVYGNARCAIAD